MRFVLISTKTSLKTLFDAIESVEKEADDIKRKLIAELSSGVQLSYKFMWFDVFHRIISIPLHRSLGLHMP